MSNVVFILGAGCSKLAGAPLMADFLDTALYLYSTKKINVAKNKHFDSVFKARGLLQRVHSKGQLDLYNIESIFNAFEMANTIKKLPGHEPNEIPSIINSLKEVIVTTLEQTLVFPIRGSRLSTPPPYDEFAQLLKYIANEASPKRSCSIITFNYDIAIDVALYLNGINYDYYLNDKDQRFPLLKLHGSLNWALRNTDNSILALQLKDYFKHYSLPNFPGEIREVQIPIGSQLQEYFTKYGKETVMSEPVIVPPTWNKADYYSNIRTVWARSARELGEAEYIFIIGYSLPQTDAFFRLLYALGSVGENTLKNITVYNPDHSDEIKSRFESILGSGAKARYNYIALDFRNAVSLIKGNF